MEETKSVFAFVRRSLAAHFVTARIGWNFVQAKLHRSYPCGRCGYRYDCPDGCHS